MPGLLAKAAPWLIVIGLLFGSYKMWMWAVSGGLRRIDRAKGIFLALLAISVAIVILSKLL